MTRTDSDAGISLATVRDAALERALVDGRDARRYFALAGVLDRVESRADRAASPPPRGSGPESDADQIWDADPTRDLEPDGNARLSVLLTCTVAMAALDDAGADAKTPATPRSPGDPRTDLVAAGAVAAYRGFDVDVETVAARAGLPRADLRRRIEETETK